MFRAASRWFISALFVTVVPLTVATAWFNGVSSLREMVLILVPWPAMYAMYSALFILPACVIATGFRLVAGRLTHLRGRYLQVFSIVTGSVSGIAVMMVVGEGHLHLLPTFVFVAGIAGGTGGAISVTDAPLWSRREILTLAAGIVLSLGGFLVLSA